MSYNQKPPGPSGSGMGGGPPNGPNNIPQVAKTFAGIQQQMQNLVHGQNAIPQSAPADINAFLQQQRIQTMFKQQQQFLQFQMQAQQQQQQHQQQQQQQLHNMPGGGGVGTGPVGGPIGVGGGGAGSGGAGGSGEPLALTRTPGAAELLNKTYQQQANGNPATNPAFNLQQTLQALPTNFVQHLQAFQYQMQAKQMQQQQHGGGQGHQGGHGQQQPGVQGVPPPPTTTAMSQQHQQKHQHQQQQNAAALSTVAALQQRYLTAAAAQAAAVSGNKMSSATSPPPPPPLTNQMKPPNLPPNTQITPVSGANVGGGNLSSSSASAAAGGGPHQKLSTGNTNTGLAKHQAPSPSLPTPSISLIPSKQQNTSTPSVAHQQNKFMPPTNTGGKSGHSGHSQNIPKSTHGGQTTTSNTTSPAKTGTNAEATGVVAALKSPQSTPVQLTKQIPAAASTATLATKTGSNITASTTTGVTSTTTTTMVSPQKSTPPNVATTPSTNNTTPTTTTTPNSSNTTPTKASVTAKPSTEEMAKTLTKPLMAEKEAAKLSTNDNNKKISTDSIAISSTDNQKKDANKQAKEKKLELPVTAKTAIPLTPTPSSTSLNPTPEKASIEVKSNKVTAPTTTTITASAASDQIEQKILKVDDKPDAMAKLSKTENHSVDAAFNKDESEKKSLDAKKIQEKNKPSTEEKSLTPVNTSNQEKSKKPEIVTDDKKSEIPNQTKKSKDEIKTDKKEENVEKEKKPKSTKTSKIEEEIIITKDAPKKDEETEKSNTAVETKSSPTPPSLSIPIKPIEKTETTVKSSLEKSNKNDKQEAIKHVNEKVKEPVIAAEKIETARTLIVAEVKEEKDAPKVKEEQIKAETKAPVKSITVAKKTNANDSVKESSESPQKEVASMPVKKLARLTKATKSKAVATAPATPTVATESKTPDSPEEKPSTAPTSAARVKRKPKVETSYVSDSTPSTPKDDDADRKSKRHRLKTILYQSPLPELAYITKLSASEASNSPKPMSNEDRLIVFYKNEYMAVRNAEGTFYLCQTMQNVYRTSPRISIRWLSEDAKDCNVFIPDFYDHTDIECVLTTVELKRIDKGHLRLPKSERTRIENILKKAIDVEKGIVPRPDLTEENPDGLDISLFKDESQIEKKSAADASGGNERFTTSTPSGRKSRRGTIVTASSLRKSRAAVTPSKSSIGNKGKRGASSAASASSSPRKSPAKKRKTLIKRKKKKADNSDDEDDDETSDSNESDTEYKPTQKRSSLNTSAAGSKTAPRAQRSPLAKARAASPITPTTSRSKNVPQKTTPTPSTSKVSRGERAAKRKSLTDAGSSEENPTPVKKPMTSTSTNNGKTTTYNNKNKAATEYVSNEATTTKNPVKNPSLIVKLQITRRKPLPANTPSHITKTLNSASVTTNRPQFGNTKGFNISGNGGGSEIRTYRSRN